MNQPAHQPTLTAHQRIQLLLSDIAMSMAIRTYDAAYAFPVADDGYQPGYVRDTWMAARSDAELQRRVFALANAGMGSLQQMEPEKLQETAKRFGVPLDEAVAIEIETFFSERRERVLRYRR